MSKVDVIVAKMDRLSQSAHDNIDFETLIDYGLSEEDKEEYYRLQEELYKAEEEEEKKKKVKE